MTISFSSNKNTSLVKYKFFLSYNSQVYHLLSSLFPYFLLNFSLSLFCCSVCLWADGNTTSEVNIEALKLLIFSLQFIDQQKDLFYVYYISRYLINNQFYSFIFIKALASHKYNLSTALSSLVPGTGPVLCRDEMEDWSSAEAGLFEEVSVLSYTKVLELLRLQHKHYTEIEICLTKCHYFMQQN